MTSSEDIIKRTFAELDRYLRPASIAQIGGFRPPENPLTSWFGGRFVGLPDEEWPSSPAGPMIPLLQVHVSELPYCPPALANVALLTVFHDAREHPTHLPAPNGNGWLIRTYSTLEGLVPLNKPDMKPWPKPFPVRWHLAEDEGPNWEDAWSVVDLKAFNELDGSGDLFYDRYSNAPGTKFGWPSLIQHELENGAGYVFQIGSEEKAQWTWGDGGVGYFCLNPDGVWNLEWQCY